MSDMGSDGMRLPAIRGPVLLTGATGFIGAHVARRLTSEGVDVVATYRTDRRDDLDVRWEQCGLADGDAVGSLVRSVRPGTILHLASYVAGSRALELVEPTFSANLASTVYLLTAAVETEVRRVVLAGSLEEPDGSIPNAVPSSPYAAAKWAATGYARMLNALYELDVVTARVFMVYGPAQRDERKLIPYVINTLLDGQSPEIGSGTRPVDWVFVDDVVEGLLRMAGTPDLGGQRVDLGSGETHTVRDVVLQLAELVEEGGEPSFGAVADRAMEQIRVANLDETRSALGWAPQTSLKDGLQATIDWYRARRRG